MKPGLTVAWVVGLLCVVGCSPMPESEQAVPLEPQAEPSAPPAQAAPQTSTDSPPPSSDDEPAPPRSDAGIPTPNPEEPTAHCFPEAGGPYWTTELEAVELTIRCTATEPVPDPRFEIVGAPAGATVDPVTGKVSWRPALDQAGVYALILRETTTQETGTVKVGVADAFDRSANAPVDPLTYTEEYGIPVMHISFADRLASWEYRPATVVYRGRRYEIQAKYRGATSLDFPKRSFTLEFPDTDEFNDPLVGFGNRDKLVLITLFNDNSYVRPRLAFELWRRMDPENLKVKTFPVVVFRNGVYYGLYTAADHIDSDLIRRHGLNKDGNLYKAFHADANFGLYMSTGEEKWALWQGYEKKEGTPAEGEPHAKDDIAELTRFVIEDSDATFRAELGQRVVLRDYENWWIFVTMILATDSGGKNAYHYRDAAADGPFRYLPWDLDASFGQDWDTRRNSPYWRKDFAPENGMFRRMLADPALIDPARARFRALLRGELSRDKVLALYDELQDEIRPVARRDEVRWGQDYRTSTRWADRTDLNTYEQEAAYVRQWIDKRWRTLEQQGPP